MERIYGGFQKAGVKVTTTGKSNVDNDGTNAYAAVVVPVGADGLTPASDANPVPVTSPAFNVSSQFTRPNDTTPYSIGDVVGGVLTFAGVASAAGQTVMIDNVSLMIALSAIPSGMTSFTLQLYSASPPSAYADNTAWDLPSGDRSVYLGPISVGSPVDAVSTLYVKQTGLTFQGAPAATSLFGYLVTATAYTPAAQTVYTPTINGFAV